jgi:hypothetical protein
MIPIKAILFILLVHWIADFILQTDWQAKNKSTNEDALFEHVYIYSLTTGLFWFLYFNTNVIILLFATFLIFTLHVVTDHFTSRFNKKLWEKGDTHNFFVSVGFDQFLHYAQLLLVYYFLIK